MGSCTLDSMTSVLAGRALSMELKSWWETVIVFCVLTVASPCSVRSLSCSIPKASGSLEVGIVWTSECILSARSLTMT